jgi:hypothetical protein
MPQTRDRKKISHVWLWLLIGVIIAVVWLALDSYSPTSKSSYQDVPSFSTKNPSNDKLLAMSEPQQAKFLGMVVEEGCVGARAFYMGTYSKDNSAFWSVGCTNGRKYAVQIFSDSVGSTKVLECEMLKMVAHVSCFQKFK